MAPTIPTTEPTSFAAGETVQWRRSYGDYPPADGYALKVYLRGPGVIDPVVTDSGSDWLITISAASSKDKPAGTYHLVAYAEKGAGAALERYEVVRSVVLVTPNIVEAAAGALQSEAEKTLALIDAAIAGRIPAGMESYSVAGRAVSKIPIMELKRLRELYRTELRAKRRPRRAATNIVTVFGRAR